MPAGPSSGQPCAQCSGNANDGTPCSDTSPEGGAPRALDTDPPILRIDRVGVAGSTVTDNDGNSLAGQEIDLVIRNVTYYEPFSSQWTYISGEIGKSTSTAPVMAKTERLLEVLRVQPLLGKRRSKWSSAP